MMRTAVLATLFAALAAWAGEAFPMPARFVAPPPLAPPAKRKPVITSCGSVGHIGPCPGNLFVVSPNGGHVMAWLQEDARGRSVINVDGKRWAYHGDIALGPVRAFSPDGTRLACVVGDDGERRVFLDDREVGPYDVERGTPLVFSPDGKHLAYGASRNGTPILVVDGTVTEAPGWVSHLQYDPTGARLAYIAQRETQSCLVVDGVPGPWCDEVCPASFAWGQYDSTMLFTPAGNRPAALCRVGKTWTMRVEGREPLPVPEGAVAGVFFSPDGSRQALVTGWHHADTVEGRAAFSPDSAHLLRWVRRDRRAVLLYDGQPRVTYPLGNGCITEEDCPIFTPDGAHWAVVLRRTQAERPDDREALVVDGVEVLRAQHITDPVFSPDGRLCAYLGMFRDGHLRGYVNGDLVATMPRQGEGPGGPTLRVLFSTDSRHIAFVSDTDVSLDGRTVSRADGADCPRVAGAAFSPDSRHLVWCEARTDGWHAMINGHAGPAFPALAAREMAWNVGDVYDPQYDFTTRPLFDLTIPGRLRYVIIPRPRPDEDAGLPVAVVEETFE